VQPLLNPDVRPRRKSAALLIPWNLWFLLPFCAGLLRAQTNPTHRLEFREPRATSYLLEAGTTPSNGIQLNSLPADSWTTAQIEGATNTVELSSRLVVRLKPGHSINELLTDSKLAIARRLNGDLFILQASDSPSAIEAAVALARDERVLASYPVMRRPFRRHNPYEKAPNDPLFRQQWHLENRGSDYNLAGPDLNVRAAWPFTHGEGVLVGVGDDGFQIDHPDLIKRAAAGPHFNFFKGAADGNPASSAAKHATAVAGLIAAEAGNKRGVSGVAPQAELASWVIFGTSRFGADSIATDEELMDMFQYASNRVSVQNHSWGSTSTAQMGLDALSDAGIATATTLGRDGKGAVIVRAGGNERESLSNANDDGYSNDPRAIAVAAVRKDGRVCSYSSPGACLLVAAPSGDLIDSNEDGQADSPDPSAPDVLTTDRTAGAGYNVSTSDSGDYAYFNGTSASSPQIAGVAALILSANPALAYRDVQQILILSARHFDLQDPDVRVNGAGLRVSHNLGFGVPDAAAAVQLAKVWSNRPPLTTVSLTNTARRNIPDNALEVICAGPEIPEALSAIHCLPTLGLHPDDPTAALPLVYVGQANSELTEDLRGKGALIQRGTSYFSDKIARAAKAGAAFAIIFNDRGTNEIQAMGGTTFAPIPAVSIGKADGEALRDFIAEHSETTAQLRLTPAVYRFQVARPLLCEHVGVRLMTTHPRRSDVRVTLVSPAGTRSVLQTINQDSSAGPRDWTYWSVQHFFEGSLGEWRLEVSDERGTTIRNFTSGITAATGAVTYAELIVQGVDIVDADGDGLDDRWEMKWFGNLNSGPKDDPDGDGINNAREQMIGTDPTKSNAPFQLDFTELATGFWRLSWPAANEKSYTVLTGEDSTRPFRTVKTLSGRFPVGEFVVRPGSGNHFYRILREQK